MGDIADMILEGLLDEETGEYIGDRNKLLYGEEAPGFPVSYYGESSKSKKDKCPICGKLCAAGGPPLQAHMQAKHKRGSTDA